MLAPIDVPPDVQELQARAQRIAGEIREGS